MKHPIHHARKAERPRSVDELRRGLKRSLSDLHEGWRRCGNKMCRRGKQCFGEGAVFKCVRDGGAPRKLSPGPRITQL